MNILSRWLHLCAPECCLLCHASASGGICRDCLDDLCRSAVAGSQCCPRCGGIGDGISPCGGCQRKPPPFEKLWSSLHYEPPVSGLLHEFKHLRQIALKRLLAELMAALPPPWLHDAGIDSILAVPLSRERLVERGFNQCGELARLLSARYGLLLLPEDTVFRRPAPPQSTLPYARRKKNVAGLFRVVGDVKKRNLLLIDDVATTNATLAELSRMLKRAGAGNLYCWTLAQAKMQKS